MRCGHWCLKMILLLTVLVPALLSSCTRKPPPPVEKPELRIVCLVPSVTHMIVELGRGDAIVGVIAQDPAAPQEAAVVMSSSIDYDALLGLRPTHVIVSSGPRGPEPRLLQYERDGLFQLLDYPYPGDFESALYPLTSPAEQMLSVGWLLDEQEQAHALAARTLRQLDAVGGMTRSHAHTLSKPRRALVVMGLQSPGASGPGSVNHELMRLIGAVNAVSHASTDWVRLDAESIRAARPDVVLMIQARGVTEADVRRAFALDPETRVAFLNDPLFNLPSVNMADSAAQMARLVYPELADAVDAALEHARQDTSQDTSAANLMDGVPPMPGERLRHRTDTHSQASDAQDEPFDLDMPDVLVPFELSQPSGDR